MFIYENDTTPGTTFVFIPENYPANEKLIIKFEYLDLDSTLNPISIIVTVDSIGDIDFNLLDKYCEDDNEQHTLTPTVGHNNGSGQFYSDLTSGFITPTNSAIITPEEIGASTADSVEIKYIYTSGISGCQDSITKSTWINKLPVLSTNLKTRYNRIDSTKIILEGTPLGGTFIPQKLNWIDQDTNNIFYPFNVATKDIGKDLTMAYEYTDTITGCYNKIIDTFQVDIPRGSIANINNDFIYCYSDTIIELYYQPDPNQDNKLSSKVGEFTISEGYINDQKNDSAFIYPDKMTQKTDTFEVNYKYWGINNEEYQVSKDIIVFVFDTLFFAEDLKGHYCAEEITDVELENPTIEDNEVETFSIVPFTESIIPTDKGLVFRTNLASVGVNTINYILENTWAGCKESMSKSTIIHEKPTIDFYLSDLCIADSIRLEDSSKLTPGNTLDTIVAWQWIVEGIEDTLTSQFPMIKIENEGVHKIKLRVKSTSQAECWWEYENSNTKFVSSPDINFNWKNECFGIDTVIFNGKNNEPTNTSYYIWDFGDGSIDSISGINTSHFYTSSGKYNVSFSTGSENGCSDIITKTIHIRPVIPVIDNNSSYKIFEFENGEQGWYQSYKEDTSWNYGIPNQNNSIINQSFSGNYSWGTNLNGNYFRDDTAYLTSPCFDIRGMEKPMVKSQIIYDLQDADGVILQYSSNEKDWENLGDNNEGIEWFNSNQITSDPGANNSRKGWSGNSDSSWLDARLPVTFNSFIDSSKVRFRFAFASQTGNKEGFAFDDFWIGERDRLVLVEHFMDATVDTTNFNTLDEKYELDVINIQYHYSSLQQDPLYLDNTTDPLVRSFYYDILDVPYYIFDGKLKTDEITSGVKSEIIKQTLKHPEFSITGAASIANNTTLSVTANITALSNHAKQKISTFVAVIEEEINGINAGDNTNITCKNVVKKLLPNASGMIYNKAWELGDSEEFTTTWTLKNIHGTTDNIKVVIFVQNVNSREVYQAHIIKNADISTGINNLNIAQNKFDFIMYPNPATDEVYIVLSNNLPTNSYVQMFNTTGLMIYKKPIEQDKKIIKLDLEYLSGLHYVRIISENRVLSSKKIVVIK